MKTKNYSKRIALVLATLGLLASAFAATTGQCLSMYAIMERQTTSRLASGQISVVQAIAERSFNREAYSSCMANAVKLY
jgi:hypothetical protein